MYKKLWPKDTPRLIFAGRFCHMRIVSQTVRSVPSNQSNFSWTITLVSDWSEVPLIRFSQNMQCCLAAVLVGDYAIVLLLRSN